MTFKNFRAISIAMLATVFLAACGGDESGLQERDLDDITLGPVGAPAVLVEYASSTCAACAGFHSTMSETIKQLADEGKLRFVFREFPRDAVDLAGFSMARCAGTDKYFDVLDDLFENQQGLFRSSQNGTLRESLTAIAARHGMDRERFEACLVDESIQKKIEDARAYGISRGVGGTPTLFFNDIILDGADGRTPESLIALVESLR